MTSQRLLTSFGFQACSSAPEEPIVGDSSAVCPLVIYGYRLNGKWVYVGQTRQLLAQRDREHRTAKKKSRFDNELAARPNEIEGPFILAQTAKAPISDETDVCRKAFQMTTDQKWMDQWEKYWIAKYGTYTGDGYNQTAGGQAGWRQAYFESQIKVRLQQWQLEYLPLFRLKAGPGRLWAIPQQTPVIGSLLNSMRTGETKIPAAYLPELNELGYHNGRAYSELQWELEYLPLFRLQAGPGRLWAIPRETPVLGKLLNHMRTGHTKVPAAYLPELNELGYHNGRAYMELQWELEYLPLFRLKAGPGRLWTISRKTPILGELLHKMRNNMRNGETKIPAAYLPELNELGYYNGRPVLDLKWELDYMPAVEESLAGRDHRLDRMSSAYTSPDGHRVGEKIYRLKKNPIYRDRFIRRQPVVYCKLVALGLLLNT